MVETEFTLCQGETYCHKEHGEVEIVGFLQEMEDVEVSVEGEKVEVGSGDVLFESVVFSRVMGRSGELKYEKIEDFVQQVKK